MMFRIKKLDIFITKQFGLLFVGTFFICQFVLMMQFLWRYVDELIGKGLSLEVLAQFFWYMGLMLIPQALPLAILLSSLITFGNLGESSELTAIKAAGISLLQTMRSLIGITLMVAGISLIFQNYVGPSANRSFSRLLFSMKQKNPELEIPEGIFYDGIPNSNLYVEKKNLQTGKLYGIMIYRQTGSYEDQAIILADSGMLQSTAEKKHLLLTLWSGEWFENMQQQDMAGSAEVPYRRETFAHKQIVLDFDDGFTLADAASISGSAQAKGIRQLVHDIDSIDHLTDSLGHTYYEDAQALRFSMPTLSKDDSTRLQRELAEQEGDPLTLLNNVSGEVRLQAARTALMQAKMVADDLQFKGDYTNYVNRQGRMHRSEVIGKFTLALSCIIFFFIGAPLGAIIRKGGLGVPVIISVLVFIVYYIFDNTGMRMSREDEWAIWFGKWVATMVLAPLAIFFTYKANKDSTVFNMDAYRMLFMRMLGLRTKRNIQRKEVIIHDPDYAADAASLGQLCSDVDAYCDEHRLLRWPSPISVFFRRGDDHEIERISEQLEATIEDLGYTRDRQILHQLNHYPMMATHAHTRPFERRWLNIVTGLVLPLGIFFYFRMLRFRLRLYKDLRTIRQTSNKIIQHITHNYEL